VRCELIILRCGRSAEVEPWLEALGAMVALAFIAYAPGNADQSVLCDVCKMLKSLRCVAMLSGPWLTSSLGLRLAAPKIRAKMNDVVNA
jgi:hypothetical protein